MPLIRRNNNGTERKVLGTLDPDKKTFTKRVKLSKHLYKKSDSWGIDSDVFNDTLYPDYTIIINEMEERKRYSLTAAEFAEHGAYLHFKVGDKDYGAQIFVPRKYWKQEDF